MNPALPKVLLANEIGIGRGHIAHLAHVVKHMGKGFTYLAGLHRLEYAAELNALGVKTFRSKGMFFSPEAMADHSIEGNATWGDYLFGTGLAREDLLRGNLVYWMNQITLNNISLLVAEYAPIAILAAKVLRAEGWDISIVTVGTGYSLPPPSLEPLPVLMPDVSYSTRSEADVLALVNRVLADFKAPPLPRIAAIYDVDVTLALTFSFLDPYRKWRGPSDLVNPAISLSPNLDKGGDEVFVYFSTHELNEPAVVDALCDLPLPRRAYLPNANEPTKQRLAASGVILENAPVPPDLIAARTALILHGAQHGTICMASFIGRPQVGLPQQLEQLFLARRSAQQGILELLEQHHRSKDNIINLTLRSYHSAAMQTRARDFAAELAQEVANPRRSMAARLAPLLEGLM